MYPKSLPLGVLIFIMPDRPDGLLAEPSSAKRRLLSEPPARMSSPLAASSRSVLPARLEAGPWILEGELVLPHAAIRVEPVSALSDNACRHAPSH